MRYLRRRATRRVIRGEDVVGGKVQGVADSSPRNCTFLPALPRVLRTRVYPDGPIKPRSRYVFNLIGALGAVNNFHVITLSRIVVK